MSNATVTSRTELKHLRLPKAIVRQIEDQAPHPNGFTGHVVAALESVPALSLDRLRLTLALGAIASAPTLKEARSLAVAALAGKSQ